LTVTARRVAAPVEPEGVVSTCNGVAKEKFKDAPPDAGHSPVNFVSAGEQRQVGTSDQYLPVPMVAERQSALRFTA
jgi:hypothetical protein